MKKFLSFLILSTFFVTSLFANVLITEIADPNNNANARYVELFNSGNSVVDLSTFELQRWTNGNADPSGFTSLSGTLAPGAFFIACKSSSAFSEVYGMECDMTGGSPADSNGDDQIALFESGSMVDFFGVVGEDGTNTWHEFEDGRVERNADATSGCSDSTGCESLWTVDGDNGNGDGAQDAPGGYDPGAWIGAGEGPTDVYGCTDLYGLNYNSEATADDGSCEYADHQVEAGMFYYAPADLVVEMGESVQWNNVEGSHDVVVVNGPELFSLDVTGPGVIGSYTFTLPGVYEYICSVGNHEEMGMVGSVVVNGAPEPENLFFSEYAEGSSNNKYLEIFNGTDGDVDLSSYSLSSCSNGCDDGVNWDYPNNVTFEAGTTVSSGDVHVVCHGSADEAIVAECDQTFTYLSNGDDVFALTQVATGAVLDIIGLVGDDPGSGWDVAGVTEATKNHTLVRKASVSSGNALWLDNTETGEMGSAGSDAESSEWVVLDQDTWTFVGSHPHDFVYGCMDEAAINYNSDANLDDGSCEYGGVACELGDVYVTEAASAGDPEDFIEIFNSGSDECSLAGFMLDDSADLDDLTFGDVTIAAGGYWLGYEDEEGSFSSGLNQDGETIYFSDGVTTLIVEMGDAVEVDGVELSQSYDADGNGCYTSPTPGADNVECFVFTYGCTDETATNYNADANWDDGTCEYGEIGESANLFFSEYAEGSSNNKYLEIYNASDEAVDLTAYAFPNVSNGPSEPGTHEYWNTFGEGSTVAPGDVFVICHGSADEAILAECDQFHTYLSNGDDGFCLVYGSEGNFEVLDCIGDIYAADYDDPGSAFDVCGEGDTKDNTLVRNSDVTSGSLWAESSAAETCQWTVYDSDTWTYLGYHTMGDIQLDCEDESACNFLEPGDCVYPEENYNCDGSCAIDVDCAGVCGGDAEVDECGTCDNNSSNDCTQDCSGEWGGMTTPGDVNDDSNVDVLDIVAIVATILDDSLDPNLCADVNNDGNVDVLDIVAIVAGILNPRVSDDATQSKLNISNGTASLDADGFIGAVQMTLSHGYDFSIDLTTASMVSDYRTDGNSTTLIIVAPESDELFTASSDFTIQSVIVANSNSLVDVEMPAVISLSKAYPNPFNPSTTFSVFIPSEGFVNLSVYNVMGQLVDVLQSGNMADGYHSITWNASSMTSGVYFVRVESLNGTAVQKVMLMK